MWQHFAAFPLVHLLQEVKKQSLKSLRAGLPCGGVISQPVRDIPLGHWVTLKRHWRWLTKLSLHSRRGGALHAALWVYALLSCMSVVGLHSQQLLRCSCPACIP